MKLKNQYFIKLSQEKIKHLKNHCQHLLRLPRELLIMDVLSHRLPTISPQRMSQLILLIMQPYDHQVLLFSPQLFSHSKR